MAALRRGRSCLIWWQFPWNPDIIGAGGECDLPLAMVSIQVPDDARQIRKLQIGVVPIRGPNARVPIQAQSKRLLPWRSLSSHSVTTRSVTLHSDTLRCSEGFRDPSEHSGSTRHRGAPVGASQNSSRDAEIDGSDAGSDASASAHDLRVPKCQVSQGTVWFAR
jgi:hypothetical protein